VQWCRDHFPARQAPDHHRCVLW